MTIDPRQAVRTGLACILSATVLYASVPVFLRYFATQTVVKPDAFTVNGIRYGVAALVWLPVAVLGNRWLRRTGRLTTPRPVWIAAIVPAVVNIIMQTGWAHCPYYVEPAVVGFSVRISFLFAILLGLLFVRRERRLARSPLFWTGAAISLLGLAVALGREMATSGEALVTGWKGPAIVLVTALFWAGYAVSVKVFMPGYPSWLSFGVICLYTAAGLEVLMLTNGNYTEAANLSGGNLLLMVVSALVGITASHVLLYSAIHNLGPVVANGALMVTPFVTLVLSVLFLGEALSGGQFAGGLLLVTGGGMLVWSNSRIAAREAALASPGAPPSGEDAS